jgi:hypothetical protein
MSGPTGAQLLASVICHPLPALLRQHSAPQRLQRYRQILRERPARPPADPVQPHRLLPKLRCDGFPSAMLTPYRHRSGVHRSGCQHNRVNSNFRSMPLDPAAL